MSQRQTQPKSVSPLRSSFAAAIILSVAIACDRSNQQASTNNAVQDLLTTSTPLINPANATLIAVKLTEIYIDDHFPEIKETALAGTATAIALTPTYTPAPMLPTPTLGPPEPTPTLQMGLFECNPTAGFPYVEYSCWRGVDGGRFIYVIAGREKLGADGDPGQGIIMVFPPNPYQVYRTPGHVGAVQIASVDGTTFTLLAVDPATPATYIFNLATRQFETQSGTPIPTTPVAL